MADGTLVLAGSITKNGTTISPALTMSITVGGNHLGHYTQAVGTSEEALELPADIASNKVQLAILVNNDSTNNILVGKTGNYFQTLYPGDFCVISRALSAIYVMSDAGTPILGIYVVEYT